MLPPQKNLDGKVLSIKAEIECGACGMTFEVMIDPALDDSVFDAAIDSVRATLSASVQGGYILCSGCTRQVDEDKRVPEEREAVREEIREILKIE